ncbi:FecR family protein [Varunaivibrio sulfuroxidans]|uniref:FecR family protein n=1 Tax=Varunaivibrio sulfuroxidans TaxID=1773489 RepID=A0A4R3JBK2_9PROT|nr:FecR domain-containing protein [Varunaivibrio sulfuroxidans]TCS62466.1 FecR family protein [Varunaivibrio sulfuroxidans]WES30858.1 FecR domain-containing protein [Varunaivibrio sulfuroxidans]
MTARVRAWMKKPKKRNAHCVCWGIVLVAIGAISLGVFRAAPSAAADVAVGVVREVRLDVFGTPPLRRKVAMVPDDQVYRGEVLETGARAFLRVLLKDDTHLTLGANSALVVDDLVFDPVRKGGRLTLNLFEGAFHYVSGKLPKQAIRIETSSATIGIRGTELIIRVARNGATTVGVIHGRAFIRSRESGAVQELKTGTSSTVSAGGFEGRPLKGIELTNDEGVDGYVSGVAHWREEQKQPLDGLEGDRLGDVQEAVHDEGVHAEGDGAGGSDLLGARQEGDRGELSGAETRIDRADLQEGDRASSEQGMGGGDVSGGEGDQGGGDRSPERDSAQSRESAHDTGGGSDGTSSNDHGERD